MQRENHFLSLGQPRSSAREPAKRSNRTREEEPTRREGKETAATPTSASRSGLSVHSLSRDQFQGAETRCSSGRTSAPLVSVGR